MLRTLLDWRGTLALGVAAAVGTWGLAAYPVPQDEPLLGLIGLRHPLAYHTIVYGYTAMWFSTPLFVAMLATSCLAIIAYGRTPRVHMRPLPPYPPPETRPEPSIVIGETHHATAPGRAPSPTWLTIPRRGLYTGVIIVGATGTGKTSACMHPFVDQLLRWRASDGEQKIGGLVMEVKGDFCHDVQRMLERAGRSDDYVEIGLKGDICYNPLHNDVDPYALAYAVGTLINQLFGKSKEPFWQQAYVDLLRNVILLRRIADGYTTLAEVYRYALDDGQVDRELSRLKKQQADPPDVLRLSTTDYHLHAARGPWTLWFAEDADTWTHPYDAELEAHLAALDVEYTVQRGQGGAFADRRHQVEAIDRWFHGSWLRLDNRLRSSIVEGIVVFLSLFDADPVVYRTFCPPRAAYANRSQASGPRPLPPITDLLEAGCVLALNFPVAFNPALARVLGVMLKLDFQRAVLQRIPRIAAEPNRIWRDLVFVADEYHALATVGETDPTGDERTFALSRQARLMPIVATQSLSSLRSALPGEESWRTLLQCFRTKLFLSTADEFTARTAADLCARRDQLKPRYTLSESGQGAHISLLSGRPTAQKHTFSASKTYTLEPDYIFPQRVFMELKNAQAVALPYDGLDPLPPQFVYLKPHYLDVNTSYFDHVARGTL